MKIKPKHSDGYITQTKKRNIRAAYEWCKQNNTSTCRTNRMVITFYEDGSGDIAMNHKNDLGQTERLRTFFTFEATSRRK